MYSYSKEQKRLEKRGRPITVAFLFLDRIKDHDVARSISGK